MSMPVKLNHPFEPNIWSTDIKMKSANLIDSSLYVEPSNTNLFLSTLLGANKMRRELKSTKLSLWVYGSGYVHSYFYLFCAYVVITTTMISVRAALIFWPKMLCILHPLGVSSLVQNRYKAMEIGTQNIQYFFLVIMLLT